MLKIKTIDRSITLCNMKVGGVVFWTLQHAPFVFYITQPTIPQRLNMLEPTISMTNDEVVKQMADKFMLENTCMLLENIIPGMVKKYNPLYSNLSKLYEEYTNAYPNQYLNPLILEEYCKPLDIKDKVELTQTILDDLHYRVVNIISKNRKYIVGNKTVN